MCQTKEQALSEANSNTIMFISKEKKNSTMFDYSQLKKEGTDRKAMNGMERHINIPN